MITKNAEKTASAAKRNRPSISGNNNTSRQLVLLMLLSAASVTMAQNCIPLTGSVECSAFNTSSISTNPTLTGLFPFLAYVSDAVTFDEQLRRYITTDFIRTRFQQQIGCSAINLTNTTYLYPRYAASVLCNAIIQNSVQPCGLSADQSRPLCADSCAESAISESEITSSPELCGAPGPNALSQIRADFTNCALPARSLTGTCITGAQNEPNECGFSFNLPGLCSYCAASSPNATDSCCAGSNVEERCEGVHLPVTTSMPPLFPSSTSSNVPLATNGTAAAGSSGGDGLTGGAIAGIVVGSVVGAALLLGLLILGCLLVRRKKSSSPKSSVFNQPSPTRGHGEMSMQPSGSPARFQVLPGGRVARMAALENSPSQHGNDGSVAQYRHSSSDEYADSPGSAGLGALPKRSGSLSSNSVLGGAAERGLPQSPSDNHFSSPEGIASGQSEQLAFFKDYYSQDEIHPGDRVSVLWAYQPRANDEFELERGDMLKVVGIWDDGWATGVKLVDRAEEWTTRRNSQRDSGVSNGSRRPESSGGVADGEIKAFPLVCVCLPQHWKKTIEGDSTTDTGSSGQQPH